MRYATLGGAVARKVVSVPELLPGRRAFGFGALITVAVLIGCGETTVQVEEAEPGSDERVPADLLVLGGHEQEGTVAERLAQPLVVQVNDAEGLPLPGASVEWVFSVGEGTAVDAPETNGPRLTVSTDGGGRSEVLWTLGGRAGRQEASAEVLGADDTSSGTSARFTANGRAGPPASIAVVPAELELMVSDSAQLEAVVHDAFENVIEASQVSWESNDDTVVGVDEMGMVTARAAGEAAIDVSARCCDVSDLVHVVVDASEPDDQVGCPGTATADPAVLFCDDFDDGVPISSKWNDYNSGGGSFTPVAGVGVEGSTAMRMAFAQGQLTGGYMSIAVGDVPDSYSYWQHVVGSGKVREIYWREYVRFGAGWNGVTYKQSRVRVLDDPEPDDLGAHRTAFQGHFWPDTNTSNGFPDGVLFFNNTRGVDDQGNVIDRGNNTNTSVWLPRTAGQTVIYKDYPQGSQWLCIEGHIRLNDPGESNGIEEFWLNDQLEARRTDQNHIGTYDEYGINQVLFDNYWNNGAPQANTLYRDNIVISTERIGCLAG